MKLLYNVDDNPQLRVHVAILYPEDQDHKLAIERSKDLPYCSMMLHDEDLDEKGEYKKEHYHLIYRFDKGYYRKKLVTKDLFLDWEKNWHYFKSLEEIDYNRVEDYAIYLTHIDNPNKHYYKPDLYEGGDRNWAIDVCSHYAVPDDISMLDILDTIEQMRFSDHNFRFRPMKEIYVKLYKKYGLIVYRKWNFIRPFITDYLFQSSRDDNNDLTS